MTAGNILIVDDEDSLRTTLTRVLQVNSCEATSVSDGKEALRQLQREVYDLVFLDLNLPGQDGIQVLSEIRTRYPYLAVVILTGYGSLQTAVEALRLGAIDYLLKPFDPGDLVERAFVILRQQAVEQRKRAIKNQIADLETELAKLERDVEPLDNVPNEISKRYLYIGPFVLDHQTRRATLSGCFLNLPPSSFDYLMVLARRSPEVVPYITLVSEAQRYQVKGGEARELTKWHIHVLRQAIEDNPQKPRYLINVRGIGYRLVVD